MGREVILRSFKFKQEADIAKGFLDLKGISNHISCDERDLQFRNSSAGTINLIVQEEDLEKAKMLIESLDNIKILQKNVVNDASTLLLGGILVFSGIIAIFTRRFSSRWMHGYHLSEKDAIIAGTCFIVVGVVVILYFLVKKILRKQ